MPLSDAYRNGETVPFETEACNREEREREREGEKLMDFLNLRLLVGRPSVCSPSSLAIFQISRTFITSITFQ